MKILILGAAGMLGHKLLELLGQEHEVVGTVRGSLDALERHRLTRKRRIISGVDASDIALIARVLANVQPAVVINCIGVIKQLDAARVPSVCVGLNSLFPHLLDELSRSIGIRLIHISTDCVFSGSKGMYDEADLPDPVDLYGRSKLLGEISTGPNLTLRTSIIGRELGAGYGLIDWFFRGHHAQVRGFRKAIFSGFTTIEFARIIMRILEAKNSLQGLYHVSSDPINKYDLLCLTRSFFGIETEIIPTDFPIVDRSLNSTRFRSELAYQPPAWDEMIRELAVDSASYSSEIH